MFGWFAKSSKLGAQAQVGKGLRHTWQKSMTEPKRKIFLLINVTNSGAKVRLSSLRTFCQFLDGDRHHSPSFEVWKKSLLALNGVGPNSSLTRD